MNGVTLDGYRVYVIGVLVVGRILNCNRSCDLRSVQELGLESFSCFHHDKYDH